VELEAQSLRPEPERAGLIVDLDHDLANTFDHGALPPSGLPLVRSRFASILF
jgi:hypothetical protein